MMKSINDMLLESIKVYGLNDLKTIELSTRRDLEVVKEQRRIYEEWKSRN